MIIAQADLPLVDGDYCWADGKSVSTYDRSKNDSSHDGIFVAMLISMMMMVFLIDNVSVQHGGCDQHRCWNHWLRRGDIMSSTRSKYDLQDQIFHIVPDQKLHMKRDHSKLDVPYQKRSDHTRSNVLV